MFVAVDGEPAGLLGVADPIKDTTAEAIRALHAEGIRDRHADRRQPRRRREAVAQKLGIDEVVAEVLPDQKAEAVKQLQAEGRVVAMAGDGINDAPALAQAQVGIAMGTGTDVAMESAGVTLVKGDLRGIVRARRLSRATMRNIRQNLFFAFVYNALGVPIAAGVLYPVLRAPAQPDDRRRGDELQLGLGDRATRCGSARSNLVAGPEQRAEPAREGGAGNKLARQLVGARESVLADGSEETQLVEQGPQRPGAVDGEPCVDFLT